MFEGWQRDRERGDGFQEPSAAKQTRQVGEREGVKDEEGAVENPTGEVGAEAERAPPNLVSFGRCLASPGWGEV